MSKTFKAERPVGAEYWGRRPSKAGSTPGRKTKQLTHRLERRHAARGINAEIAEVES